MYQDQPIAIFSALLALWFAGLVVAVVTGKTPTYVSLSKRFARQSLKWLLERIGDFFYFLAKCV